MVIHVGLGFLLNNQKQNLETLCETWQRSLFYGKSMAARLIERIEAWESRADFMRNSNNCNGMV